MRIINAFVCPMDGPDIPQGFVQWAGGKITALGPMDSCPGTEEEVIDARGSYLLPGLVDAHCHLGLCGDGVGFEGEDCNEITDPCTPHLRAIDGINPLDRTFQEAREAGVTTVLTGPGSANPVAGQIAAIKTSGCWIDDMVLAAPAAIKFALGENPKMCYHDREEQPYTRMATAAVIRENLYKAKEYLRKQEEADKDEDRDAPDYDAKLEALVPLLKGEIPAHFHAHRADDIATAVRIAREFGLNYVIIHGTEGHRVAENLARAGASVVVGPLISDRSKPELVHSTLENPAVLSRAGVPVAICTDHPELPLPYLPLSAAMAVKNGMDARRALEAITITAAKIAGVDSRVGSLTPGKDADLVLFDRHPFDVAARAMAVFIDGVRVC